MISKPKIKLRRAYDGPAADDGIRVLVDRVWPRGLRKEDARIDEWYKDIAPSTQLRKWYAHDPARFAEFARRYQAELEDPQRARTLEQLRQLAQRQTVTLLTATKNIEISQAAVLVQLIQG
jgi:uncharacterized protein YeaO (DUF488 family)